MQKDKYVLLRNFQPHRPSAELEWNLKMSEWLGSIPYYILEIILADHNLDRWRSLIRRFDPNPRVLISGNDYKTWQGILYVLQSGEQTEWDKR